jgi:diaminopimelate decarboxylase
MGESVLAVGGGASSFFPRTDGVLRVEGVDFDEIADAVGTPAYVYSAGAVRTQYQLLERALAGGPHRIHYSVKANGNLALLRLMRELGAGVDIVSGGEMYRALAAGYAGSDIVFSGVGKSERELETACDVGVHLINVESADEVERLSVVAAARGVVAPVGIRVNPNVAVDTPHPYTRTGEGAHKFGVPVDRVVALARRVAALPGLRLVGVGMHIGSQISETEPYQRGVDRLLGLVAEIRAAGVGGDLAYLDLGGGLAVSYDGGVGADVAAWGRIVTGAARSAGLALIVEPGRFLVANAGVLLTRVLYRKRVSGKTFVITDGGMTELLRPSHYQAYHRIEAVVARPTASVVDVCGPVCESGDFLALDREVDDVEPNDLLVVHSAGAYGFVMASTYNARPRAPEVLVDGARWAVVRRRETYDDLVSHELAPPEWRSA